MKPHQIDLITSLSVPTVDPTGHVALVAATRANFDTDSYTGQLWQVHLDGSQPPRRFTRGKNDSAPQFSPDGTTIAFLRPNDKGRNQIAIVDARGGEPTLITNRHLGVSSFAWSPDSTRIAFVSATPEADRYGTLDGVSAAAENPRRVTTNKMRANGAGWILDRTNALFVLDVPDLDAEPYFAPTGRAAKANGGAGSGDVAGANKQKPTGFAPYMLLSHLDFNVMHPVFSPDSTRVYFASAQHESRDADLRQSIYSVAVSDAVSVTGGKERDAQGPAARLELSSPHQPVSFTSPQFSANGETLYVLGQELGYSGVDFVARHYGVYGIAVTPRDIASGLAADALPALLTDNSTVDYGDVHTTLVPTNAGVLAFARVRGSGELHHVNVDSGVQVLSCGHRVITGAAHANDTTVVVYTDPATPGELAVLANEELTTRTEFAAPLAAQTHIAEQREFHATAPDGYPVHGWIYKPEGDGPHPVLLNIHGGPFADYHWAYFDEAQAYVEAGYAVVQCNPRGSAGYGLEHGTAITHAMGTVDKDDVLAFLEQAVQSDSTLDGERLGILGGSYGGYLTAWIIGHDHRFKGAIVERGFLEPFSFVGTSDIGWFFADGYTGTDPDRILAQSPMAVATQVTTPTLVMHSEEDLRCPFEQAQRYYMTLKRAGVETEMLAFPGENHELSRSGTPWHRAQRFEAILDWWNTYLPVTR